MARTRVRDGALEIDIQCANVFDLLSTEFHNIVVHTGKLNTALPMVSYAIARVGVTDVWNLTAVAVDTRAYSSTITITVGVPYYTLTSLPAGTDAEILAFLTLARLFAVILKLHEVTSVAITWTP